jgi:hypothetical protein
MPARRNMGTTPLALFALDVRCNSRYVRDVQTTPPALPSVTERLSLLHQGLRQGVSWRNPLTRILLALLLPWLNGLFSQLAALIEQIKAGDYQPSTAVPPQLPAKPRNRQSLPAGSGRQRTQVPEAIGQPAQPVLRDTAAAPTGSAPVSPPPAANDLPTPRHSPGLAPLRFGFTRAPPKPA